MNPVITGDARELIRTVQQDAFVISDPPYNVGYHYATYKDQLNAGEYLDMLRAVFGGRKAVIIHYPEETINLLGGGGVLAASNRS
jgi:DNA modification methylase